MMDLRAFLVLKVMREYLEFQVFPVTTDFAVRKATQDHLDYRVKRAKEVQLGHPVFRI